jgi:hypothetical protein
MFSFKKVSFFISVFYSKNPHFSFSKILIFPFQKSSFFILKKTHFHSCFFLTKILIFTSKKFPILSLNIMIFSFKTPQLFLPKFLTFQSLKNSQKSSFSPKIITFFPFVLRTFTTIPETKEQNALQTIRTNLHAAQSGSPTLPASIAETVRGRRSRSENLG